MTRVVARVDLGTVRGNLARMRSLAGPADVMVVVKADAYGHGMVPVARTVSIECHGRGRTRTCDPGIMSPLL